MIFTNTKINVYEIFCSSDLYDDVSETAALCHESWIAVIQSERILVTFGISVVNYTIWYLFV